MAGASIAVRGIQAALKAVERTKQGRALPDIVGTLVVAGVKAGMVKGVDPDTGKTWAPLKNREGRALLDTRRLSRSIHYEKRGTQISVGTNLIYAATHQFGDPNRVPVHGEFLVFKVMGVTVRARKVVIPQRRYIPMTTKGLDRVTAGQLRPTIEKYLRTQWA